MQTEANLPNKEQEKKKRQRKRRFIFCSEDFKLAFVVKRTLKENQSHYKVRWLENDMTHNSWVTKEDIKENVLEVLATYQNTLANAAKCMLRPRQ